MIIHEPLGAVVFGECCGAFGNVLRAHRPQHPVATDTEVPVGQGYKLGGCEVDLTVWVGEQHEVIARAVPLGEMNLRHGASLTRLPAGRD